MFKKLKRWIIDELFDQQCWMEEELNIIRSKQEQKNKELKDRLNILEDNQNLINDISHRSIDNKLKIDYIQNEMNKRIEYQRENIMLLMEYFGLYFDYKGDKKVIKKEKKK